MAEATTTVKETLGDKCSKDSCLETGMDKDKAMNGRSSLECPPALHWGQGKDIG